MTSPRYRVTRRKASPRLPRGGAIVIAGRAVPLGTGALPEDFPARLDRLKQVSGLTWEAFAEALGVQCKQVLRWRNGTEPRGGAYHALVRLVPWIPGGLDILMGEDFLAPHMEA
ncbi:MAG: hypothetical protein OXI51_11095 [Chloroflexota bacterium]|nr:hypothetical protein [Chloroflexota bacterium]